MWMLVLRRRQLLSWRRQLLRLTEGLLLLLWWIAARLWRKRRPMMLARVRHRGLLRLLWWLSGCRWEGRPLRCVLRRLRLTWEVWSGSRAGWGRIVVRSGEGSWRMNLLLLRRHWLRSVTAWCRIVLLLLLLRWRLLSELRLL